ncbi:MAG: YceI family protein [Acidimicrobiales bacterium]
MARTTRCWARRTARNAANDQARDDHLRSADFFDVERHPTATFRSTGVAGSGAPGTSGTVDGDAVDPFGNERAVFSTCSQIDREDRNLTWNLVLDTGGLLVSKQIRLEIEVELIRQP